MVLIIVTTEFQRFLYYLWQLHITQSPESTVRNITVPVNNNNYANSCPFKAYWCFASVSALQTAELLTLILLMWRIGWAPNSISIYIQQDAKLHSLFILSGNCSTCFGWYFHPSSGAHSTVSTASGICHTVTAICRYRGRVGTGLSVLWVAYATHCTLNDPCIPDPSQVVILFNLLWSHIFMLFSSVHILYYVKVIISY
jgi:membrane associated rhomboid family serine protease